MTVPEVPIEDGQRVALMILLGVRGNWDDEGRYLLAQLIGHDVEPAALSRDDWQAIRERAYPGWRRNEWEVGEDFAKELKRLRTKYLEEVLGQGSLFG